MYEVYENGIKMRDFKTEEEANNWVDIRKKYSSGNVYEIKNGGKEPERVETTPGTKECPFCFSQIDARASVCPICRSALNGNRPNNTYAPGDPKPGGFGKFLSSCVSLIFIGWVCWNFFLKPGSPFKPDGLKTYTERERDRKANEKAKAEFEKQRELAQNSLVQQTSKAPRRVSVKTLTQAMKENPIKADNDYYGQDLLITDEIKLMNVSENGTAFIVFENQTGFVMVMFLDSAKLALADYKKGQVITIVAKYAGIHENGILLVDGFVKR